MYTPKLPSPLVPLPNELWLLIFSFAGSDTLTKSRLVSKRWRGMANFVLHQRLQQPLLALMDKSINLQNTFKSLEAVKKPDMAHYQTFMALADASDISESIWYPSPPVELRSVCECLVRLYDRSLIGSDATLQWAVIKKTMSKYEFKQWYINMKDSVKMVEYRSSKDVEDIIRQDPLITYERLRVVSLAGYRILIQVAACLQYCNIQNELHVNETELKAVQSILSKTVKFMNAVKSQ
ncbi:hypothetical protein EDD86DRAFT_104134 [Gorgonomyces haynaldii]|nr:hypothetical protein EDD86DRAFT_104134 [Gorgonomyces haynaldii]